MQLLGDGRKDKVDVIYAAGDLQLIKLVSGAFQFGVGKDARIVTDLAEVGSFGPHVQMEVSQWLQANGPRTAMQDKTQQDIHEQSMATPGSLDARLALLENVSPGLKGEVQALLDAILIKHGLVHAASDAPPPTKNAGYHRAANEDEIRAMAKAGMPFDPEHPPKVWEPDGDLAGPASALRDEPDMTPEMREVSEGRGRRLPSAQDILSEDLTEDAEVGV
jgi:hypothetical protein